MSKFRLYLAPYADDAGSGYGDFQDVTEDVLSFGSLQQQLDNTEYDIGIFRASNCRVKFRNDHGLYGPAGTIDSIFKFRRGGTRARITWQAGDEDLVCGFFDAGEPGAVLSEERTVFEGIVDDNAAKSPIDEQSIEFLLQGYEAWLGQMLVPTSLVNGTPISQVIYAICNQAPFTNPVTVLQSNITCGMDVACDDVSALAGQTCREALSELLEGSNSVLYIRDNVLYVAPRTANAGLAYTFYGWASLNGVENIIDIDNYRAGEQRVINYVAWGDGSVAAEEGASVAAYGYRKKEVTVDAVTNNTNRAALVAAIRNEFAYPKQEFDLKCRIDDETLELYLLDRIAVDYPSEYVVRDGTSFAIYGIGTYGVDFYATPLTRLEIDPALRFKVMSRKIDIQAQVIIFGLREI